MKDFFFIDVDSPTNLIHQEMENLQSDDDIILFSNSKDTTILFLSFYTQYIINKGGYEVALVHGNLVKDLGDLIYQLNCSLPASYELADNKEALYDLLLNFETEPNERVIIWNDAQKCFLENKQIFIEVFDLMIASAFLNRHGLATVKPDGTPYRVKQRNIFLFNYIKIDDIDSLIDRKIYIPAVKSEEVSMNFNIGFLTRGGNIP